MGPTDENHEIIKPYLFHTGELTPPEFWRALETRFTLAPGASEPDKETRRKFCALWDEIQNSFQDRLNALITPGPLSLRLIRDKSEDDVILEVRKTLLVQKNIAAWLDFFLEIVLQQPQKILFNTNICTKLFSKRLPERISLFNFKR